MGKHSAVEVGGQIVAAQVRDEDKAEFYANDEIWDHEYCADGDACDNNCSFTNE